MTKKLNEDTTYSASVTMNDGEGNKTASINTDDYNELARFLELSGIKASGNDSSSLPPACGEGWADDNPMNMDAAGYETGGDAVEVDVELPGEENPDDEFVDEMIDDEIICQDCDGEGYQVSLRDSQKTRQCPSCSGSGYVSSDGMDEQLETDQAEYDHGHVPDRPRPYSLDVYDYKGRPEGDTDRKNFRRVNNYGDNALPKTEEEELDRLTQLAGAPAYKIKKVSEKDVEEGMAAGSFKAMDKLRDVVSDKDDDEDDIEEARARGPNSREDTMLAKLDKKADSRKAKFVPKDEKDPDDKYAAMAKKHSVEEADVDEARARGPNNREDTMMNRIANKQEKAGTGKFTPSKKEDPDDKYAAMAKKFGVEEDKSIEALQARIEEELNSFLGEFGNRKVGNPVASHPLHRELMSSMEEMIRWAGGVEKAAKSVAEEFANKMQISSEAIRDYLISEFNGMSMQDITRSQRHTD